MERDTTTTRIISRATLESGFQQLTLDMPGKSANIITEAFLDELKECLDEIDALPRETVAGILIKSAKPKVFVAGADLVAIGESLDWSEQQIKEFCARGQQLFARLGQFPFPSIAGVHGVCVGGGLELALACDYRICSDARHTQLGLPEVHLGLIPGWAGTVRLPRLIGLKEGIELVTTGRSIKADEADALLLVDDVVPESELLVSCTQYLAQVSSKGLEKRRRTMREPIIAGQIKANRLEDWHGRIEAQSDVYPQAPRVAAEHMIRSAGMTADEAMLSEAEAMTRVWGSEANRGLLHQFFVNERVKKNAGLPGDLPSPRSLDTVGILGTGQMGAQIAEAFAKTGKSIVLYDARLARARSVLQGLEAARSGKGPGGSHLRLGEALSDLAECDLVIESVVENLSVKRELLSRLESHLTPDTIIASNTSSIPIREIGRDLQTPERFLGVHFCHPLKMRRMCELIPHEQTDGSTLSSVASAARGIGQPPIQVGDQPAFVVNRLLAPMFDQAIRLLDLGIGLERIESAARKFGLSMGPFEFIDAIGIDTLFYAGTLLAERMPHLVGRSSTLPKLIKANRLGQKTQRGFFDYDDSGALQTPQSLSEVLALAGNATKSVSLSDHEIQMNLLMPMLVEAFSVLEQEIVRGPGDIDFCTVRGCGFPAFRGGLLFWADQVGYRTIHHAIDSVSGYRPQFAVPTQVAELSKKNGRLHD